MHQSSKKENPTLIFCCDKILQEVNSILEKEPIKDKIELWKVETFDENLRMGLKLIIFKKIHIFLSWYSETTKMTKFH